MRKNQRFRNNLLILVVIILREKDKRSKESSGKMWMMMDLKRFRQGGLANRNVSSDRIILGGMKKRNKEKNHKL